MIGTLWVAKKSILQCLRYLLFVSNHHKYVIVGYKPEEIAPMFFIIAHLGNVFLPLSFCKVLTNKTTIITNDSQMTGAIGESLAAAAGYKPAPQLGR